MAFPRVFPSQAAVSAIRSLFVASFAVAIAARAAEYVVPVSTGTIGKKVFTTTVAVANPGAKPVTCHWTYLERGGQLRVASNDEIAAGQTLVHEDFGGEAGRAALGIAKAACSADVTVAVRVQSSDEGRVFNATAAVGPADHATALRLTTTSDILFAETGGQPIAFSVLVTNAKSGEMIGEKYFEVAPYGVQVVNLGSMFAHAPAVSVEARVDGDGQLIAEPVTTDPAFTRIAVRMPPESRAGAMTQAHIAANPNAVNETSPLNAMFVARFKGAPFQEPFTGLINMRDRWYDPRTGTFLSPDPEGYVDSSNLYSYCHGDPVNCTDPTGRLGDGGDLRADFREKENAERAKRFAAWCAANPVECRKVDVRGAGVMRMVGGVGQTTAGVGAFASTGPLPEPVTKTLGGTAIVRGIDNTVTGAVELWTGEQHDTMTGRALYLAMVKAGVSRATASRVTGWTETGVDIASSVGSSLVPGVNAALRIRPINGVINIGGTGEAAATNLNPLLGETGGQTRNVPNLVKDYADQIGRHFEPGSARTIISNRLPAFNVNWPGFARGAYATLKPGGVVHMNLYISGSAAEQAAIRAAAIRAFQQAGFTNVYLEGESVGTFLHATR